MSCNILGQEGTGGATVFVEVDAALAGLVHLAVAVDASGAVRLVERRHDQAVLDEVGMQLHKLLLADAARLVLVEVVEVSHRLLQLLHLLLRVLHLLPPALACAPPLQELGVADAVASAKAQARARHEHINA